MADEVFSAFAQNFRALYSSILSLSMACIVVSATFFAGLDNPSCEIRMYYVLSLVSFIFTMLIFIVASFIGVRHECAEGTGGKDQRDINKQKLKIITISIVPFIIGMLCFCALLIRGLV